MDKRKVFNLIKKMRAKSKGSACIKEVVWGHLHDDSISVVYHLNYFNQQDTACEFEEFESIKKLEDFILNFKETPNE